MGSSSSKQIVDIEDNSPKEFKFCVKGEKEVGKTCLAVTYTTGEYPKDYVPTIMDSWESIMNFEEEEFKILVWDQSGAENYTRIRTLNYPKTDVFLLCYSVVSRSSFEVAKNVFIPELKPYLNNSGFILVGTKIDLRNDLDTIQSLHDNNEEPLTFEDGLKLAEETGALGYMECSALTGTNISPIFEEGFRFCIEKSRNVNNPSYNIKEYKIALPISKAKSARK